MLRLYVTVLHLIYPNYVLVIVKISNSHREMSINFFSIIKVSVDQIIPLNSIGQFVGEIKKNNYNV